MTKELDTSWFDLKNYDKLNELDLYGWTEQIAIRQVTLDDIETRKSILDNIETRKAILKDLEILNGKLHDDEFEDEELEDLLDCLREFELESVSKRIKNRPIVAHWSHFKHYPDKYKFPFNTVSVYGTGAGDHRRIADDDKLSDVWELLKPECILDEITDEQAKLIRTPIDMIYRDRDISMFHNTPTHVTVDLAASDEQIMSDFRQWLTEYRKVTARATIKKLFTQADFDYWIQYGVIPYLDLILIAKIEGKKITQNQLARLIFPNDYDVDIVGRLRQVTKPTADRLMKDETCEALRRQILHEKVG